MLAQPNKGVKIRWIYLYLAFLLPLSVSFSRPMIAIQNVDEVFYEYLPLTSCSSYINDKFTPGNITYTSLDPFRVFSSVQLADGISFWGVIEGGLSLLINQQQILKSGIYQQVVYFNSSLQDDFINREFILTNFTEEGNIILYFATASTQNITHISLSINNSVTTNFSSEILEIIQKCLNEGQIPQITSLKMPYFLMICPNSSIALTFDWSTQGNSYVHKIPNITGSIKKVASNPQLFLPSNSPQIVWQVALLIENEQALIFCSFNESEVSCSDYLSDLNWLQVIAQNAWGLEEEVEEEEIISIMELYPQIKHFNFPGDIISVFRDQSMTYVESQFSGEFFLAVFDQNTLMVNTSLIGNVVLYNGQSLVIQTVNNSLFLTTFSLPFVTINDTNLNSFSLNYSCQQANYSFNYQIFWTNPVYPTSIVLQLDNSSKVSNQGVYTYDLSSSFQVIGPAFQVFVKNDAPLTIALLSAPVFSISDQITAILEVDLLSNRFPQLSLIIYFLDQLGQLKAISSESNVVEIVAKQPCAFTNTPSAIKKGKQYVISNQKGDVCICQAYLKQCKLTDSLKSLVSSSSEQNSFKPAYKDNTEVQFNMSGALRQQLYGLIGSGLLVNVYQNGWVQLQQMTGPVLDLVYSNCSFNSTGALVFKRDFKDDLLLIFCEGGASISQYLLRNNHIVFNREIPLYEFTIRPNGTFFSGINYIFVEADISSDFIAPGTLGWGQNCCVLRIDPDAFTVSSIVQIVEASQIILVESLTGADVVYYNESGVYQLNSYLKIYFSTTWISFSKTPLCIDSFCSPVTYPYNISFASLLYNFASSFPQNITFDLNSAALNVGSASLILDLESQAAPNPEWLGVSSFNFSWLCGPLMSFNISAVNADPSELIYLLATNIVVVKNKIVNAFASSILQIMDLGTLSNDYYLSQIIMVVEESSISFYYKFTDIWLQPLLTVTPPSPNCFYFLYSANTSELQFASSCQFISSNSPSLTFSYMNSSFQAIFGSINYPIQLRNIISFSQPDQLPYVLGLEEGPSQSITGTLNFCQSECGSLQMNTTIGFVVDYDAKLTNSQILVVVGLDIEHINIWVGISPPTIKQQMYEPNFSLLYSQITAQYCDSVTLVDTIESTSPGQPTSQVQQLLLIISCATSYYQVTAQLPRKTLILIRQYSKFLSCDFVNKNKPLFTLNSQLDIDLMIVQCLHNRQTVRTLEFEAINSSSSSIVTAYLQVYAPTGPLCGGIWHPIRIIPLAVDHTLSSYLLYQTNSTLKLLYEQINGLIIDSFINPQPSTELSLIQLTKQSIFPSINLTLSNPFYIQNIPINIQPPPNIPNETVTIILEIAFIVSNALTLLFMICWLIFKRNSKASRPETKLEVRGISSDNSRDSDYQSQIDKEQSLRSSFRKSKPPRRVTQIQLFQPRYNHG